MRPSDAQLLHGFPGQLIQRALLMEQAVSSIEP